MLIIGYFSRTKILTNVSTVPSNNSNIHADHPGTSIHLKTWNGQKKQLDMRVFQGMEEPCVSAKDMVFLQVLKYVSTMTMAETKSNIFCFNIASCNLPVKSSAFWLVTNLKSLSWNKAHNIKIARIGENINEELGCGNKTHTKTTSWKTDRHADPRAIETGMNVYWIYHIP